MNPTLLEASAVHKDAMLFSVSKFLGGASTPSVLVVKNKLYVDIHRIPSLVPNQVSFTKFSNFFHVHLLKYIILIPSHC